jgi:peptidylprolyl isomerase
VLQKLNSAGEAFTCKASIKCREPIQRQNIKIRLKTAEEGMTVWKGKNVILHTTMGDIKIELFEEMPITAGNFAKLVDKGFYDGTIFHRVIDKFMIQGGDPTGTGMGGPGYQIPDEFTKSNRNNKGTFSMANAGPNTGGSQFFINLVDNNHLDRMHPVFGKVVAGMEVVDSIGKIKTDRQDRPKTEVKITKAELI